MNMNTLTRIILASVLATSLFSFAGCNDEEVTKKAAEEAARTLKKWQDQNR